MVNALCRESLNRLISERPGDGKSTIGLQSSIYCLVVLCPDHCAAAGILVDGRGRKSEQGSSGHWGVVRWAEYIRHALPREYPTPNAVTDYHSEYLITERVGASWYRKLSCVLQPGPCCWSHLGCGCCYDIGFDGVLHFTKELYQFLVQEGWLRGDTQWRSQWDALDCYGWNAVSNQRRLSAEPRYAQCNCHHYNRLGWCLVVL